MPLSDSKDMPRKIPLTLTVHVDEVHRADDVGHRDVRVYTYRIETLPDHPEMKGEVRIPLGVLRESSGQDLDSMIREAATRDVLEMLGLGVAAGLFQPSEPPHVETLPVPGLVR